MSKARIIPKTLVEFAEKIKEAQKTNSVIGITITGPYASYKRRLLMAMLESDEIDYEIVEPKQLPNSHNNEN